MKQQRPLMKLPNAASGPLGFHPLLLRRCSKELAKPLQCLWSKSLDTSKILALLKTEIITPIHNRSSRGLASQYRPVTVTLHLIAICEKIIRKKLKDFLENNGVFNQGQHGFWQSHSCLSQQLLCYDDILSNIQEGENAGVIYLDFTKAFDKVDYSLLLHIIYSSLYCKLRGHSTNGSRGRWLHYFLT